MKTSALKLAVCALLTTSVVLCSGCKKSAYGTKQLDTTAVIGSWQETPENPNPRMQVKINKKVLRAITINADNTFEFSVVDNDGKPLEAKGKATGTWSVANNVIQFTATDDSLKGAEADELAPPASSTGVKSMNNKQMLAITDTAYMTFYLEKK